MLPAILLYGTVTSYFTREGTTILIYTRNLQMEKRLRLSNAPFGSVPKVLIFTLVFAIFSIAATAQCIDSLISGNWFEVYKKKASYYLPLEIQLNTDKSAKYINRYPETSYNLTYNISPDSSLSFSNGERYKILFLNDRLLRLKKYKKGNIISLRKAARIAK